MFKQLSKTCRFLSECLLWAPPPFCELRAFDFYADPGSWISSTQPPHGLYEIAQLRFTVQKVEVPFKFSSALCLGSQKCCTRRPSIVFSAHLSWFVSSYSSPQQGNLNYFHVCTLSRENLTDYWTDSLRLRMIHCNTTAFSRNKCVYQRVVLINFQ